MNSSASSTSPSSSSSSPGVRYGLLIALGLIPSLVGLLFGRGMSASTSLYLTVQSLGAALAVVIFTMSLVHFRRSGEVSAPVLGVGVLCVGLLDLWQAGWVAQLLIEPESYVMVSWAFARAVFAVALLVGAAISPMTERVKGDANKRKATWTVLLVGAVFFLVSLGFISRLHGNSEVSDSLWGAELTRGALRFGPLVLLLIAAGYVLPVFRKWHKTALSRVLIIACIPLILAQVHFIFHNGGVDGSQFMIANWAKLSAYLILFIGLLIDYSEAYAALDRSMKAVLEESMVSEQAQGAVSQHDCFFDSVMAHIDPPVCFLDSSVNVIRVNDAMAHLAGCAIGSKAVPLLAIGKGPEALFGDASGKVVRGVVQNLLDSGEDQEVGPLEGTFPNGSKSVRNWRGHTVRMNNQIVAVLIVGTGTED